MCFLLRKKKEEETVLDCNKDQFLEEETDSMASSSGSGSTGLLSAAAAATAGGSSTEEELRALMEQRRAKRMLSNRESARRSRMRKQRHLDDLSAQATHLRHENAHVATALGLTTQGLLAVDAENAVLRTQAAELAARLHSLNDILSCMSNNGAAVTLTVAAAADPLLGFDGAAFDDIFGSSPEMFQPC